ncbi:hypothetical protein Droror1_Dr00025251 [Drosera rotundifolia]
MSLARGRMGCPDQGRSDEKKLKDLLQNLDPSKGLKMISRHDLGLILQEAIVGKLHISNSISGLQLQISRSVGQLIKNFLRYPQGAQHLNVVSPVSCDFPELSYFSPMQHFMNIVRRAPLAIELNDIYPSRAKLKYFGLIGSETKIRARNAGSTMLQFPLPEQNMLATLS